MNDGDGPTALTMLLVVAAGLILSMTTWFSATAILPDLQAAFHLSGAATAWLTNALQLGFVGAALGLSVSGLIDILPVRGLMVGAALLAAAANAAMLVVGSTTGLFAARVVTGMALAGLYPPALKVIAGWFETGRGLAMGAAVGALTLGSSGPYLVRAIGVHADWRLVVLATSSAAVVAAALLLLVREGPHAAPQPAFDVRRIGSVLRDPALALANLGYFGHMWELYAMWGWFLAYGETARAAPAHLPIAPALLTFLVIAVGATGCVCGGWIADRVGRPATAGLMMVISGSCAAAIGFAYAGPAWAFVAIALVWGFTIIADSAQFSALATELSTPDTRGAAIALQIGIGFLLTVLSIRLTPLVAGHFGWRWTFLLLAPGPAVGAAAMYGLHRRLRR